MTSLAILVALFRYLWEKLPFLVRSVMWIIQ